MSVDDPPGRPGSRGPRRVYRSRRRWRLWIGLLSAGAVALVSASVLAGRAEQPRASVPKPVIPVAGRSRAQQRKKDAHPAPLPIRRVRAGHGATAAVIAYRGKLGVERPAIVFLHGWGVATSRYAPWIDHLVRLGDTVIAPRYQTSPQARPDGVRAAAIAGLQQALPRIQVRPRSLVVAGHSAGGALAADLAALASVGHGLPRPVAIFAVYPGRAILGYPGGIPAQSLRTLPSSTRLMALAGASDQVVAQAPAQQMVSSATSLRATRRRYVLVTNPRVDDHFGPRRDSRAARKAFWSRLDRLIARARDGRR